MYVCFWLGKGQILTYTDVALCKGLKKRTLTQSGSMF